MAAPWGMGERGYDMAKGTPHGTDKTLWMSIRELSVRLRIHSVHIYYNRYDPVASKSIYFAFEDAIWSEIDNSADSFIDTFRNAMR